MLRNKLFFFIYCFVFLFVSGFYSNNKPIMELADAYNNGIPFENSAKEIQLLNILDDIDKIKDSLEIAKNKKAKAELFTELTDLYTQAAINFSKLGHHELAIHFFKKVESYDSKHEYLNIGFALDYLALGEFDKAYEFLRKAIEENPDNINVQFMEAEYFFLTDDFDTAANKYKRLIENYPGTRRAAYSAVRLYICQVYLNSDFSNFFDQNLEKNMWPIQLLDLFRNRLPVSLFVQNITQYQQHPRFVLVESFYYLGELELARKNKNLAAVLFSYAARQNVTSYREHPYSIVRLKQLQAQD